ncbi:MAG: hypothetical protein AB9M53_01035 [Leptothrix sp. (in: b-proteobacteria)]
MPGFSSLDQIIAALTTNAKGEDSHFNKPSITTVAGGKYTMSYNAGLPAALTFGAALTATQMTNAVAGAQQFTNATAPATKHMLTAGAGSTVAAGTVLIYDLLARYPINGTVTAGTFTSTALPTRDKNGSTAGAGVMAMVVNANATATTATTLTLSYTNSAGTAGRTTGAQAIAASAQHRVLTDTQGFFVPLQAGDAGIQTIQSYTLGATATSTQIEIQLVRPLLYIPVLFAGGYTERNLVTELAKIPRLYDGTALQMALLAGTTSSGNLVGQLGFAEN